MGVCKANFFEKYAPEEHISLFYILHYEIIGTHLVFTDARHEKAEVSGSGFWLHYYLALSEHL